MASVEVLFGGSILVGIIASIYAFYSNKFSITENGKYASLRSIALLIISFAFILHTSGDYFGTLYSSEDLELTLESIAHVFLFTSFIIYAVAANKILNKAKEYWFK